MQKSLRRRSTKRLLIRYSLLAANVLLLVGVVAFIAANSRGGSRVASASVAAASADASNPVDRFTSYDVAASIAKATSLPESTAINNQADSAKTVILSSTGNSGTVALKPQIVATALKSKKDIQSYTVLAGEDVAAVAQKFGVTSDSIKWSNNLSAGTVAAGTKLTIPPVNGIVYKVASGDTVQSLATKYRSNADQIVAYNDTELAGLKVGEQIIIPNGQIVPVVSSYTAYTASYLGGVATYTSNGYDYGYCTWYAANRRAALGNPVPSNLGDAYTWAVRAAGFGISIGSTPRAGAVAVKHSGAPGHVAVVEVVNDDGSFWISEMNSYGQVSMTNSAGAGGWGRVDWKLLDAGAAGTYTFVY